MPLLIPLIDLKHIAINNFSMQVRLSLSGMIFVEIFMRDG